MFKILLLFLIIIAASFYVVINYVLPQLGDQTEKGLGISLNNNYSYESTKGLNKNPELLKLQIEEAFNDNNGAAIEKGLTKAFETEDPDKQYKYFTESFALMKQSYLDFIPETTEEKKESSKMKAAIVALRNYVSSVPNYKSGDFVIPK
jgi:hypothetical protein